MTTRDIADVQTGMSLDDYIRRFDREGAFEIINGREIVRMPSLPGHQSVIFRLTVKLGIFVSQHGNRSYIAGEAPYVIEARRNWVKGSRVPDLMLIKESRWLPYIENEPKWSVKPLSIIPDLAVEIVSLNDAFGDVIEKAMVMLNDGVAMVWIIDPFKQFAQVMTKDGTRTIDKTGTLETGDILPGFSVTLAELFA